MDSIWVNLKKVDTPFFKFISVQSADLKKNVAKTFRVQFLVRTNPLHPCSFMSNSYCFSLVYFCRSPFLFFPFSST